MTIIRLDPGFTRWDELLTLIFAAFASMNGR
ncbi:GNAT family N-acetyltransferase, partial [Bradyrhizobium sp. Lot11]